MCVFEFEHGVEEEKIWISEHLGRAQCDRPLLGATLQLANITSLSNVVHSHRPRLQHVLDVGRSLLSQPYCHVLPQHPRSSSPADIETKLTQLEATWQELETLVRQQKERLRGVSNANYPTEHQVIFTSVSATIVLKASGEAKGVGGSGGPAPSALSPYLQTRHKHTFKLH